MGTEITEKLVVLYHQFSKSRYRVHSIAYPVRGDFFQLTAETLVDRTPLEEIELYRGRSKAQALEAIQDGKDRGMIPWEKLAHYLRTEKERRGGFATLAQEKRRAEARERLDERDHGKKVKCRVCSKEYHHLPAHIRKHSLTVEMYERKYPGAPLYSPYAEDTLRRAHSAPKKPRQKVAPKAGLKVLNTETLTGGTILSADTVQATIRVRGKAVQISIEDLYAEWRPVKPSW